jgi:hypothetical protein
MRGRPCNSQPGKFPQKPHETGSFPVLMFDCSFDLKEVKKMAWQELFGTTIGQLSLFTIVFVVIMAIFLVRYFSKKMDEDAHNARKN